MRSICTSFTFCAICLFIPLCITEKQTKNISSYLTHILKSVIIYMYSITPTDFRLLHMTPPFLWGKMATVLVTSTVAVFLPAKAVPIEARRIRKKHSETIITQESQLSSSKMKGEPQNEKNSKCPASGRRQDGWNRPSRPMRCKQNLVAGQAARTRRRQC